MQFTSLSFLFFLCITLIAYNLFPQKYRYVVIAIASAYFYFLVSKWLIVMLLVVTAITYVGGMFARKKHIVAAVVTLLVVILGFFKYAGFLEETVHSIAMLVGGAANENVLHILLPVGISFYVFEAISYVVDCKNEKIEPEKNILVVFTYLSFFITVTSGPIERAGRIIPQLKNPSKVSFNQLRSACLLIVWGFFMKLMIANRLAIFVDNVYSNPTGYVGGIVFLATVFYTFQIYCDFAGYSCIAIGAASLFGIEIMDNFKSPYLSESIAEFWRRWHISLSTWLKDYLYIPLGGNRKGEKRKLINLLIVFLISGLWHGAAWTFVFWGLLHGLYQIVAILTNPIREKIGEKLQTDNHTVTYKWIRIIVTFLLVNFAWVFFRADTFALAFEIIKKSAQITPWILFDGSLYGAGLVQLDMLVLIISLSLVIITDMLSRKEIRVSEYILNQPIVIRWSICIIAIVIIAVCGVWGPGYNAGNFIYMGF